MDLWEVTRANGGTVRLRADKVERAGEWVSFYRLPAPAPTWDRVPDEKPAPKLILMLSDAKMVARVRDPKKPGEGGIDET